MNDPQGPDATLSVGVIDSDGNVKAYPTPAQVAAENVGQIEREIEAPKTHTFTSSTGITLGVVPIPQAMMQQVERAITKKAREEIMADLGEDCFVQPTYTIAIEDGPSETIPHDDKSIEAYPQDADAYERWKVAEEQFSTQTTQRSLEFMIAKGAKIDDVDLSEWTEIRQMFGLPIPESKLELKIAYVLDEVILTPDDFAEFMAATARASGMDNDEVEAAMADFRNSLREQKDAAEGSDTESQLVGEGDVVDIPPVRRDAGDEGLGHSPRSMGKVGGST